MKAKLLFFTLLVISGLACAATLPSFAPARQNEDLIQQSQVLAREDFLAAPSVLLIDGEHLLPTVGDEVQVRGFSAMPGTKVVIVRKQANYVNPDTATILGVGAIYIARAQVITSGDGDVTVLKITNARDAVREGDRVLLQNKQVATEAIQGHKPVALLNGQIIGALHEDSQIAPNSIVAIDLGNASQAKMGDVLTVWRDRGTTRDPNTHKKIDRPDQRVGELMIIRTFDQVSYAVVTKMSEPLHLLDIVKTS